MNYNITHNRSLYSFDEPIPRLSFVFEKDKDECISFLEQKRVANRERLLRRKYGLMHNKFSLDLLNDNKDNLITTKNTSKKKKSESNELNRNQQYLYKFKLIQRKKMQNYYSKWENRFMSQQTMKMGQMMRSYQKQ